MPEGPEIFMMRQGMLDFVGHSVDFEVIMEHHRFLSPAQVKRLHKVKLLAIDIHGKRLAFRTKRNLITFGAGMAGHWRLEKKRRTLKHDIIAIHSSMGHLYYNDARRFGFMKMYDADYQWHEDLGPDGLDKVAMTGKGSAKRIAAQFSGLRTKQMKPALLEQSRIAGGGNIYASEICFRLGIDPEMAVADFDRWKELGQVTYDVLRGAVLGQGTRIKGANAYRTPSDAKVNGFRLMVYGRTGKPCRVCRTPIEQFHQHGRSTFWCPECQS